MPPRRSRRNQNTQQIQTDIEQVASAQTPDQASQQTPGPVVQEEIARDLEQSKLTLVEAIVKLGDDAKKLGDVLQSINNKMSAQRQYAISTTSKDCADAVKCLYDEITKLITLTSNSNRQTEAQYKASHGSTYINIKSCFSKFRQNTYADHLIAFRNYCFNAIDAIDGVPFIEEWHVKAIEEMINNMNHITLIFDKYAVNLIKIIEYSQSYAGYKTLAYYHIVQLKLWRLLWIPAAWSVHTVLTSFIFANKLIRDNMAHNKYIIEKLEHGERYFILFGNNFQEVTERQLARDPQLQNYTPMTCPDAFYYSLLAAMDSSIPNVQLMCEQRHGNMNVLTYSRIFSGQLTTTLTSMLSATVSTFLPRPTLYLNQLPAPPEAVITTLNAAIPSANIIPGILMAAGGLLTIGTGVAIIRNVKRKRNEQSTSAENAITEVATTVAANDVVQQQVDTELGLPPNKRRKSRRHAR